MSVEAPKTLAVIITASPGNDDVKYAEEIGQHLDRFEVRHTHRVGSAHKDPEHVLRMIRRYDALRKYRIAYITIAGRSDGLSHVVDAATPNPVTAAPPYSEKYGGMDILSSLRSPSGVGPAVVVTPEAAAIHTAKILGHTNLGVPLKIIEMQENGRTRIAKADSILEHEENLE